MRRLCFLLLLGCSGRREGLVPIGGEEASPEESARFLRRLYLDLTGELPTEAERQAGLERLTHEGNTAATRRALAEGLLQDPGFAATFVDELENRVYGAERERFYDQVCAIRRADPACYDCPDSADLCDCDCPAIAMLRGERQSLREAVTDLGGGASTSSIERRYAESEAYRFLFASADAVALGFFDAFLHRVPEPEELDAAVAMIVGALVPGAPAGLLFLRHGSDYADLVDIVFASDVYREVIVDAVFQRYLGRRASPAELGHFSALLDAADPDVRATLTAVVSSREYFDQ